MSIFTELRERVEALSAHSELAVDAGDLLTAMRAVGGEGALDVIAEASALRNSVERLIAVASAVVAELSTRDRGHGGLAATKGHRSPVSLVQSVSGGTRADAVRAVRLGESLLDRSGPTPGFTTDASETPPTSAPWHDGLRRAMLAGTMSAAQHEAILTGLGDPPVRDDVPDAVAAWAVAAQQLADEAPGFAVEELARRARQLRDILDPIGAQERSARRFEARSFSMWTDAEGVQRGRIVFDDEMGAWAQAIRDAALRPRRGGPRFVDDSGRSEAEALVQDTRTNEQLTYDLVMDVWRAGALAKADDVFGARQPGVRMIVVKDAVGPRDAFGRLVGVGHVDDGGNTLAGPIIDRNICMNGTRDVIVDTSGNPLDVGREQRLFTPKQRIALAARDGGCLWPGCTIPASYCEAHHADHWKEHEGRTDIDRGLLLCRFHHLLLHNNGWRITRAGHGPFILLPPPGAPGTSIPLESKAPWRWAWDPPAPPDRAGWRDPNETRAVSTARHEPDRIQTA